MINQITFQINLNDYGSTIIINGKAEDISDIIMAFKELNENIDHNEFVKFLVEEEND